MPAPLGGGAGSAAWGSVLRRILSLHVRSARSQVYPRWGRGQLQHDYLASAISGLTIKDAMALVRCAEIGMEWGWA